MNTLLQKIKELKGKFLSVKTLLNISNLQKKREELKAEMSADSFWQNQDKAVVVSREAEELQSEISPWLELEQELNELEDMVNLVSKEEESVVKKMEQELELKYEQVEKRFEKLEFLALFSSKHDRSGVLLSIYAGVGGVDAQDWAQMLERMYFRFSEREGFKVSILDKNYGSEAGIKSVTLQIDGSYAYGYLKSENGVHRLLRNSPFNADGLRQTSFALVEVMPQFKEDKEVVIKDEDIRIDIFRSSGPGGQSVNTTDSAVRVVHLASGITVSCQTERSQHQNKENALKILKAKLIKKKLEDQEKEASEFKGDVRQADWGRQIRSYFLYGNKLVKDHRTNLEITNVEAVLDGEIKPFMEAYLRFLKE